jgi:hypothetical protein
MARSQEHDVKAQIQALVDIFIEGITPKEALAVLDQGPSALGSACFAWAFESAEGLVDAGDQFPLSLMALHERAPIVRRLREAAVEAFVERFGEPRAPRLPERPGGLEADVYTELDEANKGRMSSRARILCQTVVSGMCISWQSVYYVTRNRDRSQFVLWLKWESGDGWGLDMTTQQAWLEARKGLSERDAALILLEDYWRASAAEWDTSRPNEVTAYGKTITQDELELVAERVWPANQEE